MPLPRIKTTHLERMADSFAMIQHSVFSKPDKKTGYTLDDNSRALIVALKLNELRNSKKIQDLAQSYFKFIEQSQFPNGNFQCFYSEKQEPMDLQHSPDSFGRAFWACAVATKSKGASREIKRGCREILKKARPHLSDPGSLRATSFSLLGCTAIADGWKRPAKKLALNLVDAFNHSSSRRWKWFEPYLTYSNARLPQSLFDAARVLKSKQFLDVALSSLSFLEEKTVLNGMFVPIGQRGWLKKGRRRAFFDQQPVDAGCMVECYTSAYNATHNKEFLNKARLSFEWFMGHNMLGKPIYHAPTGACFDGLGKEGVNLNQGAESVLAFLLARVELEKFKKKL